MNKKNIILGVGAIALLGAGYYFIKKRKVSKPYKIKKAGDATVYVVIDGKKYTFPNPIAYQNFALLNEVQTIPKSKIDLIPSGAEISESGKITGETTSAFDVNNYTVISPEEQLLYLVKNGKKHLMKSKNAHLNYLWSEISTISKEELDLIPNGGGVDDSGNLVKK